MKTDMISKLVTLLMERTEGMNMEEALDEVLNSDTYRKMMDDQT